MVNVAVDAGGADLGPAEVAAGVALAVQRGVDLGKALRRSAPPSDAERRVLFNQTARDLSRRG